MEVLSTLVETKSPLISQSLLCPNLFHELSVPIRCVPFYIHFACFYFKSDSCEILHNYFEINWTEKLVNWPAGLSLALKLVQYSPDNLTLANPHLQDNSHYSVLYPTLHWCKNLSKVGSDSSHTRIICTNFPRVHFVCELTGLYSTCIWSNLAYSCIQERCKQKRHSQTHNLSILNRLNLLK